MPTAAAGTQRLVVQRKGEFTKLHQHADWKPSGASMRVLELSAEWHASVFRVNAAGDDSDSGLFFDGFHLTSNAAPEGHQPHVFFSHDGKLDIDLTTNHSQSKAFVAARSNEDLNGVIDDAVKWAEKVAHMIGPNLKPEQEKAAEAAAAKHAQESAAEGKKIAAASAAKHAAAEKVVEQSDDEDAHMTLLLADVGYGGGALDAFKNHLAGAPTTLPGLAPLAVWYHERAKEKWEVTADLGRIAKKKPAPKAETRNGVAPKVTSKPSGKFKVWQATYTYGNYGSYRHDDDRDPAPKV